LNIDFILQNHGIEKTIWLCALQLGSRCVATLCVLFYYGSDCDMNTIFYFPTINFRYPYIAPTNQLQGICSQVKCKLCRVTYKDVTTGCIITCMDTLDDCVDDVTPYIACVDGNNVFGGLSVFTRLPTQHQFQIRSMLCIFIRCN
jgi:hypothetical protein